MTEQGDRLVEGYLTEVRRATASLPPARREELIDDLRDHIATQRADLPVETEAEVRSILDRLGEAETIAAEAGGSAPPASATDGRQRRGRLMIVALIGAIVLALCAIGLFFISGSN